MNAKKRRPPEIAAWILRRLAYQEDELSLLGDAEEDYTDILAQNGVFCAISWYWIQVLISLPMFLKSCLYWSVVMFRNYLKTALRVIQKHKAFSFINITGLAVGMACCVLILLWVQDELSYDRFHEDHKQLYRLILKHEGKWYTSSPWALAPVLKEEYEEVTLCTRYAIRNFLATYGERSFYETVAFVDPDFFEMFTFPLVGGSPKALFPTNNSAVITERTAKKYFGNEDPVGKALFINNDTEFTVTGIIKDIPSHSHMNFDIIVPVKLFGDERLNSWALESNSYIKLQKNASPDVFREKIAGVIMKYDKRTQAENIAGIQSLSRIHLYDVRGGGNILYVYIFSTIAAFILIIACINFMNLSTARGGTRAKEVGMRKVVGARRSNVIKQFFGESMLLSVIALCVAIGLVLLLLPAFNTIAQKNLSLGLGNIAPILLGLIGITLFTGLISGSYPALFLSAFHPAKVIKGTYSKSSRRPMLRRVLVVFQFTIAVVLIIGTIIVYKQLNYIRNKDLGFNRQQVLSLPMNNSIRANLESFKNESQRLSSVVNVTSATSRPTRIGNINPVYWEGRGPDQYETFKFVGMDFDYIKTFEMEIVDGRDFSREFQTDPQNYIVNEEAVKFMKLENPVEKLFSIWDREGQILGVVKNFHSRSLHNEFEPLVLVLTRNWPHNFVFLRIRPENMSQTLKDLGGIWKKFAPNHPFNYSFLDEDFEALYQTDKRTGTLFRYFTILAIFISCLGIFGLAAFTAEQRTKEIGVRKVLGASVSNIIGLISKEFIILLTLANVIAWPVAYALMNRMLSSYAYRTDISAWIFLLAGTLAYSIALITVSYQAFKAARTDPSNALRYE
ncbi:MAG: ABC transporter permease [Candidatus Aminicenantes bacterium]|jgi:predicted permease